MSVVESWPAGKDLNVPRGSARTVKVRDAFVVASALEEVPVRGKNLGSVWRN